FATASYTYDPQTRDITDIQTSASTVSGTIDDLSYSYTNATVSKGAGLLVSTTDKQNADTTTDTQCFSYDYAARAQQAWTATDNCTATPSTGSSATVGGPIAPYWQSWTYDAAGNRTTQTDHDTTGNTTNDTTTTYQYPTAGSSTDQPHTLTNTTATGPGATANTATYTYDAAGNTSTINGGALGNQTLTWNNQGKLASDTTAAGLTTYVYDADGNQLLRRDPASTTLYAGDTQLVLTGTTVTGTRSYTIGGKTTALRTSSNTVDYLAPDRQGTDQLTIDATTQAVTRRQYLPFGQTRGTTPTTWPGDNGYINGHNDTTTGLETLGARVYDPVSGRFLSNDSDFQANDPTQVNGYDYAGNDPVTGADPTGLSRDPDLGDRVLSDGENATDEDLIAAAKVDGTEYKPVSSWKGRSADILRRDQSADGTWDCWRCGYNFSDPKDVAAGHRNYPRSKGGNLSDKNLCAEGWACNSSAQDRGRPSPGMSCRERYACGSPNPPSQRRLNRNQNWLDRQAARDAAAGSDAGSISIRGAFGMLGVAVAVGFAAKDVEDAPQGQKVKTAVNDSAGIAGGLAGAAYGAEAGAAIGTMVPVVGTLVGGIVGGIVGGLIGSNIASSAVRGIEDWF
ncbi:RHS repeat-associated protein, partial [Kitasatospora sp. MAP12-22]